MKQGAILIVEDEYLIADNIQQNLKDMGYEKTMMAPSAERALAAAAEHAPSLILMDINLGSGGDGIELAIDLRDRYGSPVIFVTGNGETETIARARVVEPSAYLIKPFKPQELRAAVEIALHNYPEVSLPKKKPVSVSSSDELITLLKHHPCFQVLDTNEIERLLASSQQVQYQKNEHLFFAGDRQVSAMLLLSGHVVLLKSNTDGKEVVVELLQQGHCLGLFDGFHSLEKDVNARTLSESKVLIIPRHRFQRCLETHPLMYRDLTLHAAERIQMTQRFAQVMSLESVRVRISFILSLLAETSADSTIPITREQLANMIGSTVESVIRNTRAMEEEGILNLETRGVIQIVDLEELMQLIENT